MSITEKELAEKLRNECDINRHNGWNHAARKIAEAMGVTLAPEKPAPGLYLFDGRFPVIIDGDGGWWNLTLGSDPGMAYEDTPGDPRHLTPARVVPAEPVELTDEEVGGLFNEHIGARFDKWKTWRGDIRAAFTTTVNTAIAKHGGARELPGRDEMRDAIDDRVRWLGPQYAGEVADAVMALLGDGDDD